MKSIVLAFCVLLPLTSWSQSEAIEYSANGVFNWDMFRGKINQKHIAEMGRSTGAVTVSALSYKTLGIVGNHVSLKVSAQFLPYSSWTLYPKLYHPAEALNHEKRHFDICEIFARKLRKQLSEARFEGRHFNDSLNLLFKQYVVDYREMQDQYDRETQHSIGTRQQKSWNEWIDSELQALAPYAKSVVTVSLVSGER